MADELAKRGREHQFSFGEYNECPNFVYIRYTCDILQLALLASTQQTILITVL